ncbi:hypothetical protein O181_048101 [Austropuccinia psidii MF-1]|uniref:Uncharacterized protein n=1 Tax=Austropuccinia psidii MF-1 TaxID=1389203 RepID=A0A9Q3DXC7_9BASI|nr:hypothetical protein [Austropuccinia psidii MF-1]
MRRPSKSSKTQKNHQTRSITSSLKNSLSNNSNNSNNSTPTTTKMSNYHQIKFKKRKCVPPTSESDSEKQINLKSSGSSHSCKNNSNPTKLNIDTNNHDPNDLNHHLNQNNLNSSTSSDIEVLSSKSNSNLNLQPSPSFHQVSLSPNQVDSNLTLSHSTHLNHQNNLKSNSESKSPNINSISSSNLNLNLFESNHHQSLKSILTQTLHETLKNQSSKNLNSISSNQVINEKNLANQSEKITSSISLSDHQLESNLHESIETLTNQLTSWLSDQIKSSFNSILINQNQSHSHLDSPKSIPSPSSLLKHQNPNFPPKINESSTSTPTSSFSLNNLKVIDELKSRISQLEKNYQTNSSTNPDQTISNQIFQIELINDLHTKLSELESNQTNQLDQLQNKLHQIENQSKIKFEEFQSKTSSLESNNKIILPQTINYVKNKLSEFENSQAAQLDLLKSQITQLHVDHKTQVSMFESFNTHLPTQSLQAIHTVMELKHQFEAHKVISSNQLIQLETKFNQFQSQLDLIAHKDLHLLKEHNLTNPESIKPSHSTLTDQKRHHQPSINRVSKPNSHISNLNNNIISVQSNPHKKSPRHNDSNVALIQKQQRPDFKPITPSQVDEPIYRPDQNNQTNSRPLGRLITPSSTAPTLSIDPKPQDNSRYHPEPQPASNSNSGPTLSPSHTRRDSTTLHDSNPFGSHQSNLLTLEHSSEPTLDPKISDARDKAISAGFSPNQLYTVYCYLSCRLMQSSWLGDLARSKCIEVSKEQINGEVIGQLSQLGFNKAFTTEAVKLFKACKDIPEIFKNDDLKDIIQIWNETGKKNAVQKMKVRFNEMQYDIKDLKKQLFEYQNASIKKQSQEMKVRIDAIDNSLKSLKQQSHQCPTHLSTEEAEDMKAKFLEMNDELESLRNQSTEDQTDLATLTERMDFAETSISDLITLKASASDVAILKEQLEMIMEIVQGETIEKPSRKNLCSRLSNLLADKSDLKAQDERSKVFSEIEGYIVDCLIKYSKLSFETEEGEDEDELEENLVESDEDDELREQEDGEEKLKARVMRTQSFRISSKWLQFFKIIKKLEFKNSPQIVKLQCGLNEFSNSLKNINQLISNLS